MPLSSSPSINKLSGDLVSELQTIAGPHPGFRPVHARGVLLTGTFTPSAAAASLSTAPHFHKPSTPILARFSNTTGQPNIPDNDPNANPRGLAIRFVLGERVHTDVIAQSSPFFPTRTGEEFLEFLKAAVAGELGPFLGAHPAALASVQAPKPTPASFTKEKYWAVNAMTFVNGQGKGTNFRYQVIPEAGVEHLDAAAATEKGADFLHEELAQRLAKESVSFRLVAQIAEDGDVVDDANVHWPDTRKVVDLGVVKLEAIKEDAEQEQKQIIFDPVPRVQGIEPSGDPLLEVRATGYLISGRERRAAH
ncbi:hypothetical protein MMC30_000803 [Trapelia coarctata]|nr:hypothetical protein [Trapelia coarctata]